MINNLKVQLSRNIFVLIGNILPHKSHKIKHSLLADFHDSIKFDVENKSNADYAACFG